MVWVEDAGIGLGVALVALVAWCVWFLVGVSKEMAREDPDSELASR
jgi:hypothetical protein